MALRVQVPLNTALADLDETLRRLLRRELAAHGFDGVEVEFDAPTKDWAASLSAPTLNLFLYDIAEDEEHRDPAWRTERNAGESRSVRPPLRVNASYAVTAWAREVEDEHRMLSQVLAILYAYDTLPQEALAGSLANGGQRFPHDTRVAQRRQDGGADFWAAVGGQYKASIDYVVRLACDAGVSLERGPEVRTQTVRAGLSEPPRSRIEERHRLGGVVENADGAPVAGAWVVLPDHGVWAVTGGDGRFVLDRLPAGDLRCVVRTAEGADLETELAVPGQRATLVLGTPRRKR